VHDAQLPHGHSILRDTSLLIPYLDLFFHSFLVAGFLFFNFFLLCILFGFSGRLPERFASSVTEPAFFRV